MNEKPEIEKLVEGINDFLEHKRNRNWKDFNHQDICKLLIPPINLTLYLHGQCSAEFFVRSSLKMRFPHLTFEEIDNGRELE